MNNNSWTLGSENNSPEQLEHLELAVRLFCNCSNSVVQLFLKKEETEGRLGRLAPATIFTLTGHVTVSMWHGCIKRRMSEILAETPNFCQIWAWTTVEQREQTIGAMNNKQR